MTVSSNGSYNFSDNLTYMFKDPAWVRKILLGALVSIVPVLNFATGGYALKTIHNVRDDAAPPLPDWSGNLGQFFVKGVMVWLIGIIYAIPLWIIGGAAAVPAALMGQGADSENIGALIGALGCGVGLIALVYMVLLVFWFQGALVNYAVKGNFGAAFAFGEIWQIVRANAGKMVLTVIAALVAGVLAGIVSSVLGFIPCCGWIAAWVISFGAAFYVLLVLSFTCGHIAKSV